MTNAPTARQPRGIPTGGQFASNGHSESDISLGASNTGGTPLPEWLETAVPADIDGRLGEIHGDYAKVAARRGGYISAANRYVRLNKYVPDRIVNGISESNEELANLQTEMEPYDDEYNRRGGWSRFFMVNGAGGHLHVSRNCHTCRSTTEFSWMTEFSGQNETGVVDMAGEDACTSCFPSAPVNKPSMLPFRVAERKDADEAAMAKQAKQAKAAQQLVVVGPKESFKTIRGAENEVGWQVECAVTSRYNEALDDSHRAGLDRLSTGYMVKARKIADAISETSPGYDVDALLAKKFAAKTKEFRKGGWAIPAKATIEDLSVEP